MSNGNFINEGREEEQPVSGSSSSQRVGECRRLVARRYLDEKYISPDEVDPSTGFMNANIDPYAGHSEYFWTLNDSHEVEATIRVIKHPSGITKGWRFPLQREFSIEDETQEYIDYFNHFHPESIIEISGLAEQKNADEFASLDMYRRFWQHAKRSNYNVCLVSADERLDKKLNVMFGQAIRQVGDSKFVMGSQTVPSLLFPDQCVKAMSDIYQNKLEQEGERSAASYKALFMYLTDGLEIDYFTNEEKFYIHRMGINID